jgi:indole-3-acetate monooxygenase
MFVRESQQFLEAVRGLVPLIRQHAEAGLFRMLTPLSLGGYEVTPLTFYRVVEETARIDGSTGWCLYIGGGVPVQGAFIADAAAADVFGRDPLPGLRR